MNDRSETVGDLFEVFPGEGTTLFSLPDHDLKKHIKGSPKNRVLIERAAKTKQDYRAQRVANLFVLAIFVGSPALGILVFFKVGYTSALELFAMPFIVAFLICIAYVTIKNLLSEAGARRRNWGWQYSRSIDLERRLYLVEYESYGRLPERRVSERPLDEMALLRTNEQIDNDNAQRFGIQLVNKAAYLAREELGYKYQVFTLYAGNDWKEATSMGEYLESVLQIPFLNLSWYGNF
jgi:hypothetical protein